MKKEIDKNGAIDDNRKSKPLAWTLTEEGLKQHKAIFGKTRDGLS